MNRFEKITNCWALLFAMTCCVVSFADDTPTVRDFTDKSGAYSVRGSVAELDATHVKLRKTDGQLVRIAISKLSLSDQKYLREYRNNEPKVSMNDAGKAPPKPTEGVANSIPGTLVPSDKKTIGSSTIPADAIDTRFPILQLIESPTETTATFHEPMRHLRPNIQGAWISRSTPPMLKPLPDITLTLPDTKSNVKRFLPARNRRFALVEQENNLSAINLESGEMLWNLPNQAKSELSALGISDDGKSLAFTVLDNAKLGNAQATKAIRVYSIDGLKAIATHQWRPQPASQKLTPVHFGLWLADKRLGVLDGDGFADWDPFTAKRDNLTSLTDFKHVQVSPDGSQIAALHLWGVTLMSAKDLSILGHCSRGVLQHQWLSFRPDGKFIVVSGGNGLGLIATDTGKLTEMSDMDLFNARVECIDDNLMLVNGKGIFTIDKRIPVWRFHLSSSSDFAMAVAGKLIFCDSPRSRLLFRDVGDVADLNLIREISKVDYAIGPNSKVNLRVSGTEVGTYGNRLRTHLEFLAKRNQWIADPSSRKVVELKIDKVNDTRRYESGFGKDIKVQYVPVSYVEISLIVIDEFGNTLYNGVQHRSLATIAGLIVPPGKNLEQYIREISKFDPKVIERIDVQSTFKPWPTRLPSFTAIGDIR